MPFSYRDDPILEPVLAYWMRKRGDRVMPCKTDIDPIEIAPRLLPNVQILDVVEGGARFRYRLIGTALVDAYGKDYTGQYADDLVSGERLRLIHSAYQTVCRTRAAIFWSSRYRTTLGTDLVANRIYMPLGPDAQTVDHILGVLNFEFGAVLDAGDWGRGIQDPAAQYIEPIVLTPSFPAELR